MPIVLVLSWVVHCGKVKVSEKTTEHGENRAGLIASRSKLEEVLNYRHHEGSVCLVPSVIGQGAEEHRPSNLVCCNLQIVGGFLGG